MSYVGGALKLKGGLSKPTQHKKHKKAKQTQQQMQGDAVTSPSSGSAAAEGHNGGTTATATAVAAAEASASAPAAPPGRSLREGYELPPRQADADVRTPAERKYDERMRLLEGERVRRQAAKSHRERIKDFNEYLANLTEHYDIPKVGPG